MNFVDAHITYIEQLIDFIELSIKQELIKFSGEIVNWSEQLDLEKKIKVLKDEIDKRYVVKNYNHLLEATNQLEMMLGAEKLRGYEELHNKYIREISKSIDEVYQNVLKCEQNELFYFVSFDNRIRNAIGHTYYREKVSMFLLGSYRYHDIFKQAMDLACERLNIDSFHNKSDFYFLFYILSERNKMAFASNEVYQPNKYTVNTILGIDAAWTINKPSGVCLLSDDSFKCEIIRLSSSYDNFIKNQEDGAKPIGTVLELDDLLFSCDEYVDCIAVDMPVSHNRITGRRSCEEKVSKKYGNKGAATHSPTSDRSGDISVDFVKQAEKMGYKLSLKNDVVEENALIEVYPHASVIEYMDLNYRLTYKVDKKNQYKKWKHLEPKERTVKLIENLNKLIDHLQLRIINVSDYLPMLNPEEEYNIWELKSYEDRIDAAFCALTGLNYITGNITGYGDIDGTIWVPYK